ncbi:GL11840 [Drosophila persimilis]|uniref:GL11840 n=1 Tax=Drosophila persimilis TaxID=7234 RepID=B4H6Y9_DROPE|nr:GL11840 [Drosophila persimilis]
MSINQRQEARGGGKRQVASGRKIAQKPPAADSSVTQKPHHLPHQLLHRPRLDTLYSSASASASNTFQLSEEVLQATETSNQPTLPSPADVRPSPFALELQPPLAQTAEAFNVAGVGGQRSVDSYGNPIAGLRPIDTPDGRKVVSAQGLQFEIPTYASGITDIRQPADDLLPPHIVDAIAVVLDRSHDQISFARGPACVCASVFVCASAPAPIPATSLTPPKHSPSPSTTTVTTDVEVEQAQLVPIQQQQEESVQEPLVASGTLPEYIRELQHQDPDIGGPVPWTPAPNTAPLSVIAWDLLPPHLTDPVTAPAPTLEPLIITEQQPTRYVLGVEDPASHNIRLSLSSGDALMPAASCAAPTRRRARYWTTTREYAYTLPPWLQEVTDPDLDVAVTFIVPKDNDEYNHTLADDLEPPYEPFTHRRPPATRVKYTGGFGAPAGLLRPQAQGTSGSGSGANTNPGAANSPDSSAGTYVAGNQHEFSNTLKANRARPTVNPGRYTGGFGAPNGVLSVQAEPRPFQQPQQTQQPDSTSHSSRFGGPPGVLVPFDNVQRAGGQ